MKIVDRGIVYDATKAQPEARFCTFPWPERLADGQLLVAFRTGSSKDSPDEEVRIMASTDEGTSWSKRFDGFGAVGGEGYRIRGGAVTEQRPGMLIGSFLWIDHSDPTLPLANPETQGILPTAIMVADSADNGRSWSPLREVPLAPHRGNATTGGIVRLQDGTLALPYEAWKDYYDTTYGTHYASLRLSHDGGRTWEGLAIVAHDPAARILYWDQRVSVSPDDGSLVALLWTHDREAQQDLPMHITWGSPDAREWSAPRSTGIMGQIAAPLLLPGGRLFMAYVHRHYPPSLRALVSDDLGVSWNTDDELIFYEKEHGGAESGLGGPRDFGDYWTDMNVWTFGHPGALLLHPETVSGGDVLVTYYAGDASGLSVHWVRIAL
jgi:hypothetical protein